MGLTYGVAGLSITVTCDEARIAGLVDRRLALVKADEPAAADISVDISVPGPTAGRFEAPRGRGRPMYNAPGRTIDYFEDDDELFAEFPGHVALRCRPAEGRIAIAVLSQDPADEVAAAHPLLTVALHETLKRFGRFPLHAAGLSRRDRGVLVPGTSGAGKSTLTVALVRHGFDFLSDDTVFVVPDGEELLVVGLPDEIDVTEQTVAMVPELDHLSGAPLSPGRDKHSFRVDEVFGVRPLTASRPAVLLLPRVEEGPSPHLEPMAPSAVLVELMPNLLVTEPTATQAHLDVLGQLARSVPAYRFRPGPDLPAAAAHVASLVG